MRPLPDGHDGLAIKARIRSSKKLFYSGMEILKTEQDYAVRFSFIDLIRIQSSVFCDSFLA